MPEEFIKWVQKIGELGEEPTLIEEYIGFDIFAA